MVRSWQRRESTLREAGVRLPSGGLVKCPFWRYNGGMKQRPKGPQWLDIDLHPYAGRYIALVEGRVAAVADTAEGAFARARRTRPRRMPVILKIAADSEVYSGE